MKENTDVLVDCRASDLHLGDIIYWTDYYKNIRGPYMVVGFVLNKGTRRGLPRSARIVNSKYEPGYEYKSLYTFDLEGNKVTEIGINIPLKKDVSAGILIQGTAL